MNTLRRFARYAFLLSLGTGAAFSVCRAADITLRSPDGRLSAIVTTGPELTLRISDSSDPLLTLSSIELGIKGRTSIGPKTIIERTDRRRSDALINPPIHEKVAEIRDQYNEATIAFRGGAALVVRAYNTGIAWRFATQFPESILVERENFILTYPEKTLLTYQSNPDFWSSYENPYTTTTPDSVPADRVLPLPLLASLHSGKKVLLTDAQIESYPGLWLKSNGGGALRSTFPGLPLTTLDEGEIYTRGKVTKHAPEIARTRGTRNFPWRLFIIARQDADLLTNTLVYQLGEPSRLRETGWITPGLVTLDWWGRRNLFGVDFTGGVNTATAKYFIDFAARYGITYLLLDEGWTPMDDLLTVTPGLDLEGVLAYARSKNVKVILWAVWSTLRRQWDAAFERFSRWKIDGIKVDFMNRDDQEMVDFYYRVSEETTRRKMIALFHGAYKPDGLRRTYPHLLTREGLIEFEQCGVNTTDSPDYHTVLPFLRMVTGPADYLPGTIRNAQKSEFALHINRPMGQGTRAHTMALCVVLESPIRMLPDSPSDYLAEDRCTRFMTGLPVEWDELRVLHAAMGETVVLARRRGDAWYVGGVTGWQGRECEIDCSFLPEGREFVMTAVEDGPNADRRAIDHRFVEARVTSDSRLHVRLANGGGWVAQFLPSVASAPR